VYLASRKSTPVVETTAVTNVPSATRPSFRKNANLSATAATELAQPTPQPASNLWQRLADGEDDFQLSSGQWAEYLRQFGTNVETLLATQKTNYIRLAAELFPNDPRVQYAVVTHDVFPEAKREWLDRFKQSAPDNSIADYLSAREYLKAGDRENALKDLANAAGKSHFDDYTREQVQNAEEAQLSAGRSVVEAKIAANSEIHLPQMAMFKNLAQEIQGMQKEYVGTGDTASAETLAQWGHNLAQQLSTGEGSRTLLGQLVGVAIDRIVLNSLPADSQPAFLNGTVQQRLDELAAFRKDTRALIADHAQMMTSASENDLINFFDRFKNQGETKAMLWLRNRNNLR
jgi:hypothetical protein